MSINLRNLCKRQRRSTPLSGLTAFQHNAVVQRRSRTRISQVSRLCFGMITVREWFTFFMSSCEGRPTDSFSFEMEIDIDVVGDLDERYTLVHSIVLTVKDHSSLNLSRTRPFGGNR